MEELPDFSTAIDHLRKAFASGKTRDVKYRETQLKNLLRLYEENEDLLVEALKRDLRKPRQESVITEIEYLEHDIKQTLKYLRSWMEPTYVQKNLLTFMDTPVIYNEPYGLVLVIGAWNYPLQLSMLPTHGAIAAGNCVVIKPSEVSSHTAKLLYTLIPQYVDDDCIQVICGGVSVSTSLLQYKFDYIFYTGNPTVGKIIGQAAMKHLTPVTLELGGKSPCYLDDSVNMEYAVRRILWGKCLNVGQTCIAPDYILCNKEVQEDFLKHAKKLLLDWYGESPKDSPDLGRIVNSGHFSRLEKLLLSGDTAVGGEKDANQKYIAPTILINVKDTEPVMQEEIFGPILPIFTVDSPEEAIEFVNSREKPLTLYLFTRQSNTKELFLKNTSSGSVCINDTVIQNAVLELPFGGIGNSGFGKYHGKFSFDCFSHKKSCLIRNYNPFVEKLGSLRYPPYSEPKTIQVRQLLGSSPTFDFKFLGYVLAFGLGVASVILFRHFARVLLEDDDWLLQF